MVHKRNADGLKHIDGANIRIAIRSQLRLVTNEIDDEDKFLVQHTYHEINKWFGEEKNTWLRTLRSARLASSQV